MRKIVIISTSALCFITSMFSSTAHASKDALYPVTLLSPSGKSLNVGVELATNVAQRQKGLMNRIFMPEDEGMLFIWPEPVMIYMWMKNTYIPLDMIFAKDGDIVYIKENATPHSLERISPEIKVNQVLELNAGSIEKYGITTEWELLK